MDIEVGMTIHALRNAIDSLGSAIPHLSEQDVADIHTARFDIEQLLMKIQYPVLRDGRQLDAAE